MGKKLRIASVLSIGLSLAACGGDDEISLDDLGPELIDAFCDRAVRCGYFVDEATCKANLSFDFADAVHAAEAGRIDYHGDKAAECLDALRGATCDLTAEGSRNDPDACDETFVGTVADGGACFTDEECVSRDCQVANCTMACCQGTCGPTVATPRVGEACPDGVCEDGAFCSETAVCTALLASGGACNDNDQCGYNLFCAQAGTCADAPDRGQACPDGVCANLGDRCDQATTTCVALSGRGGPCSEGVLGFFDCQQPLACDATSLTCVDPPTVGQPCDFFCASGAFCNETNTCEATKANGAACGTDSECTSDYCDDFAASPVCADDPVCG